MLPLKNCDYQEYLCKDNNEKLRLLPVIQRFEERFGG